jgi:hypothetical protein
MEAFKSPNYYQGHIAETLEQLQAADFPGALPVELVKPSRWYNFGPGQERFTGTVEQITPELTWGRDERLVVTDDTKGYTVHTGVVERVFYRKDYPEFIITADGVVRDVILECRSPRKGTGQIILSERGVVSALDTRLANKYRNYVESPWIKTERLAAVSRRLGRIVKTQIA